MLYPRSPYASAAIITNTLSRSSSGGKNGGKPAPISQANGGSESASQRTASSLVRRAMICRLLGLATL